MKKKTNSNGLNILGSLVVLAATLFGLYWLWNNSQPGEVTDAVVDQKYKRIEIGSVKEEARKLIENKANAGNLPLEAPALENIGKTNPFVGS